MELPATRMIILAVHAFIYIHPIKASGCDFAFDSTKGNFSSPGFPSTFLSNKQCTYSIVVPVGKIIQLNFVNFDLGQLGCAYAEFKVYEGASSSDRLAFKRCGKSLDPYLSEGNRLFISFKAVYMTTAGFRVKYNVRDGCSMVFDEKEGTIVSPKFPSNYPNGVKCTYKITAPTTSKIHLIFSRLRLESSSSCAKDSLSVHEGSDERTPVVLKKCGTNTTQYLSTSNSIFLQFVSDSSENEEGFKIFYIVGKRGCEQTFNAVTGNITSPMYPSTYPNNAKCTYKISAMEGNLIQLSFKKFSLPGYGDKDRLKIYEGTDESGMLTDSRTWAINYPYISKSNNLFMVFQTDSTGTSTGFEIEYAARKGCNIHLASVNGVFTSPLYPHTYENDTSCNYTITVQSGKRIHLYFQKFELEYDESCAHDSLKIFEGSGRKATLAEILCGEYKNKQFISASNQVFLQFKTNSRISKAGFLANYYTTQINCDAYLTAKSGTIQSQNFPNNYPNNARCTYQIRGKSGDRIQLIFSTFSIQNSNRCSADSFKVYGETISESSLIETRCGSNVTEMSSAASRLYIVFTSDISKADTGFQIFFQVGPDGCGGIFSSDNGLITSPDISGKYPNNANCRYKIVGSSGKRISLLFSLFAIQYHELCKYDSLRIYDGLAKDNRTLLATRCGSDATPVLSISNQISLEFKTDGSATGTGFQIYYFVGDQGCNQNITSSNGTISSPLFPIPYPNNAFCTYSIEVLKSQRIELIFQSFMLQACCSPVSCDTLKVYDGGDSAKPLLRTMCGTQHKPLISSSNKIFIEFKSDGSIPNYGFKANFATKGPGMCKKNKPCMNNGTCVDVASENYKCQCLPQYTGVNCSASFEPCNSSPCLNGGICKNVYDKVSANFECICQDGFTGNQCEKRFDECLGYQNDIRWQRSISYTAKGDTSVQYCDKSLASGWYRFTSKAGPDMPTACPPARSCGSSLSIWANGTLPRNVGDYATLQACVRNNVQCCTASWSIRVKKCIGNGTTFNVYRLTKPPACPMVYCAGTEVPCPAGWNSPTGFTPGCTNNFPKIISNPEISPGIFNKQLQFTCKFGSDVKDPTAKFEVTWYEGSPAKRINHTVFLKGSERAATLQIKSEYSKRPFFALGTTVFCRVRSWYEGNTMTMSKSPFYESSHYFSGMKIIPQKHHYTVSEAGKSLKLTALATVPILPETGKTCSVTVQLYQDNKQGFLSTCKIEFKPGPANQTQVIEVMAKRDFIIDGNQEMKIKVRVIGHIHCPDWNSHHKVPDIVIIIVDINTERCTSSGDPHLITFDKLQVHVRTWKCAAVTCNCGIAAREGDDVIVVDMCRDGVPRARFASTTRPTTGTSLHRDETGKSFIIQFPSGAFIRIDNYRWYGNTYYANVVVQVPSDDFNCTIGLCGTFDRNMHNDMQSRSGKIYTSMNVGWQAPVGFSESWKIQAGKSLFYYKEKGKSSCKKILKTKFCTCKSSSDGSSHINCRHESIADRPSYLDTSQGWRELKPLLPSCGERKRRSVEETILIPSTNDDDAFYVYHPANISFTVPSWPTPLGKSKLEVEVYCNNTVKNSAPGKICSAIKKFDIDSFTNQCITDVQITDNYIFSMSAVRSMQYACEEIFLKNTSYWRLDSTKNSTLTPPMEIAKTLCPSLCSGHGSCVNAKCRCNESYTAADCSINKHNGPSVVSVSSRGLCDARKRNDCEIVRIRGYNFLESEKLSCRATRIKINSIGYRKTAISTTHTAYLLSFGEVNGKCNIDGYCFDDGEVSNFDSCSKCNPSLSFRILAIIASEGLAMLVMYDNMSFQMSTKIAARELFGEHYLENVSFPVYIHGQACADKKDRSRGYDSRKLNIRVSIYRRNMNILR
eukprot:gene8757-14783_t